MREAKPKSENNDITGTTNVSVEEEVAEAAPYRSGMKKRFQGEDFSSFIPRDLFSGICTTSLWCQCGSCCTVVTCVNANQQ